MRAVVKNNPQQYLNANENWNLDVVECLSKSVNLWNKTTISSLLNKTTKNNKMNTRAMAPSSSIKASLSSGFFSKVSRAWRRCSALDDKMKKKAIVTNAKHTRLKLHPNNIRHIFFLLVTWTFSHKISLGSGAYLISMLPTCLSFLPLVIVLNYFKISYFSWSVLNIIIALSAIISSASYFFLLIYTSFKINFSTAYNSLCLTSYYSRSSRKSSLP